MVLFIVYLNPHMKALAVGEAIQNDEPVLQFPVLSDVHISGEPQHQELFKRALNDMQMLAPKYNAIVFLGDNTNMGTEQQYNDFMRILKSYSSPSAEKIIAIGNHDYWEGLYSPVGLDAAKYQKRFVDMTGMPAADSKVYYDKWINNYHFITLGSEGFPVAGDDDYALISEEQYQWLEEKLAENTQSDKPIFVFLHQPIDYTVYGSEEWGAGFTDNRLKSILNQYPQVILFSGHSHYLINHPRTIFQEGFTMVNSGAVANGYTELGYHGTSQGLLVNVFTNRVEIIARDLKNHANIQSFIVKMPFEKAYMDNQKPIFSKGSMVSVEKNDSGDSATLTWESAIDNTLVDKYLLKQNGKVVYTHYMKFWEDRQIGKVSVELKNLTPETTYTYELVASDAWNNESANSLTVTFKTPALSGWKWNGIDWVFYENGKKVTGWKLIDNQWYLLKEGIRYTGWYQSGTNKYFLNDNGVMQVGWKEIDGKTYYFTSSGSLGKGWILEHNKWYYLDSEGTKKLGWLFDKEKWYYLKSDGMVTGWQLIGNNTWYYFKSDGEMITGWLSSGGKWYYLANSGAMKIGWVLANNKWYFMNNSGEMKTGWLYEKGIWYYLNNDGSMQIGWTKINNIYYHFSQSGALTSK